MGPTAQEIMFIVEQAGKPVLEKGATSQINRTYAIRRLETGFFSESRGCNQVLW